MSRLEWKPWSAAAFARAREEGKPVLLVLDAPGRFEQGPLAELAARRCVPVLAAAWDRPDVHRRFKSPTGVAVLSPEGEPLAVPERDEPQALAEALDRALAAFSAAAGAPAQPSRETPPWTGAVGPKGPDPLDPRRPAEVVEQVKAAAPAGLDAAALDLLLHAAVEWKDEAAGAAALARFEAFSRAHWDPAAGALKGLDAELPQLAVLARLYADGAAALGSARLVETARGLADRLLQAHFDASAGAFRQTRDRGSPLYADANALAALALLRAAPFGRGGELRAAAESVLVFLERQKYDPLLGMIHRRPSQDQAPVVYGLLRDNAWSALAFTEAYLVTGRKPYRDFADTLAKFIFQELWDRESGGFFDRMTHKDDLGALRSVERPIDENATAFEALWRLHETKGNANYRKWLEWGLRSLWPEAQGAAAAALARVQDIVSRGRMDFELVGRLGEPAADALLGAVHRHYAPRRIVSFVDPDDQDYIMAHKLEAQRYPRLFACVDLRRCADTDDPAAVPALFERLRRGS